MNARRMELNLEAYEELRANNDQLRAEIARLREALQEIINAWDDESVSLNQFGDGSFFDRAREALAQK